MLYLLYGQDFKKARQKLSSLLETLEEKRPDAGVFKMESEDFLSEDGEERFKELLGSQGLFGGSYIVIFDHIFGEGLVESLVLDSLDVMQKAEHVYVFIEDKLPARVVRKFEKVGAKLQEFGKKSEKKKEFNVFSLSDAIGRRDKKNAWRIYREALEEGMQPEQIIGSIFWQIKTLLLVSGSEGSEELSLKPFVLKKAKSFLSNWKREDLSAFSLSLISLYHEAHLGKADTETGIELLLLRL